MRSLDKKPTFSNRTAHDEGANALSTALARARARGPVLDLTLGNPTVAGFAYPALAGASLTPEEAERARTYEPDPRGLRSAREAVAREYNAQLSASYTHSSSSDGATAKGGGETAIAPDEIFLAASTSEAYSAILTTLCDPGDEIIALTPSYPLFEWLARFGNVTLVSAPLAYDGAWHVDVDAVARAVTPRTRAIMIVSPNNPTGSFLKARELGALLELGLPLVVDEVFSRYAFGEDASRVTTIAGETRGLVFSLGGLSKLVGLPQAKLAWIAVAGETSSVREASRRLELVLDTFLDVSTFVAVGAARMLEHGAVVRDAIRARTAKNLAEARRVLTGAANPLHTEGGWYVVVRVPRTKSEETWALELLEQRAIYTHPGAFFDFADEAYLVVSLLVPEEDFARGIAAIAAFVG
jgi:aspartate/methionine/tyrosine aminotransferase